MATFGYLLFRSAFALAEQIAPSLTGRAAFELFCRTPNPDRVSEREAAVLRAAAPFMAKARHHHLRTRDGYVVAHDFRSEAGHGAPTVLVLHGWRSRTEYMKALIEAHRDAGFRVMSLDLPGHGGSTGRRLTMADAVRAAHVAGEWFGPFAAIVGHSFGGAVAVNAVAGSVVGIPPLAASKLVLIAAPSSMPVLFRNFGRFLNLGPRTQSAVAEEVLRIAGRPLDEFIGSRQLAETPVPTLVIHAPDDREVSADHAELFAAAGEHVRLRWAPGLGHRRILSDPGIVEEALGFVVSRSTTAH